MALVRARNGDLLSRCRSGVGARREPGRSKEGERSGHLAVEPHEVRVVAVPMALVDQLLVLGQDEVGQGQGRAGARRGRGAVPTSLTMFATLPVGVRSTAANLPKNS